MVSFLPGYPALNLGKGQSCFKVASKCTKKVQGQKPNYAIDYENLGTGKFQKFHHQNTIFIPIKS